MADTIGSYHILRGFTRQELNEQVTRYIQMGWQPLGSPIQWFESGDGLEERRNEVQYACLLQAMTKGSW